jgi:hypothetical protein
VTTVTATGNRITDAGQVSAAVATCPSGTVVVGGGFSAPFTTGDNIAVNSSYRSRLESWRVEAQVYFGEGSATSIAYCRRTAKQITDLSGAGTVPGPTDGVGTATASCPSGFQLIAGGFRTETNVGANNFAIPFASTSTAPGTWSVTAVNNSSTAIPLTAHAYCVQGIRPPTILEASNNAVVSAYSGVSATTGACPAPLKPKKGKKGKKKKRKKVPAQVLSAGGFSTTDTPTSSGAFGIFSESKISGTGWLATDTNGFDPGNIQVTSQGICVG